jgi:hypothetical protein
LELKHVSYVGPPIDDLDLIARVPTDLAALLRQVNGFIQMDGGLHVRGACLTPEWHSMRAAWLGDNAFHRLYPEIQPSDLPFAEDCLGDQFLLRDEQIWKLQAETGGFNGLRLDLMTFLERAQADPVDFLSLQPLLQFQREGGKLEPGQLLAAYPPFCTKQSAAGVYLAPVPAQERHPFLADFAAQVRALPDGAEICFDVGD